jgi:deoxyribodipyrimidine photo-lyase
LGADFFLRHLIDADAASNTLSWRWVAGLQTVGKTYLATADNIARYTNGRFAPVGLAKSAVALTEPPVEAARALPDLEPFVAEQPSLLLVTHEDMHLESLFPANGVIRAIRIAADADLQWGESARRFVQTAAEDTATRTSAYFKCPADISSKPDVDVLISAAEAAGVRQIITPYAPIGPVADALARVHPMLAENGIALRQVRRSWDNQFWPHALKGYFAFKQCMPAALQDCNLP